MYFLYSLLRSNFQQMLINFVNFELLFAKLSGIHPYENCIKSPGGHAWRHVFMAFSKLEARGHLLHKKGTPPKHFSRECIKKLLAIESLVRS